MIKHFLLLLIASVSSYTSRAQLADPSTPFYVNTYGDTVTCESIKLKSSTITCQNGSEKTEIRNEYVRRIYVPQKESDFEAYFEAYAKYGHKKIYMIGPKQTARALNDKVYPRFFDMKPINEDKDFWKRGLYECLAQNNGYRLCRVKNTSSSGPSMMGGGKTKHDTYILFPENEATGITLNKRNFAEQILKLMPNCSAVKEALKQDMDFMKDVPGFLVILTKCQ